MNIFPVPIEMAKLSKIDNDSLVNYAYSLKDKNDGRIVANKGGFQSNNLNFNDISGLMVQILSHISAYCGKLNLKKNTTINYTNAWLNINGQHDYNMNHTHNGFISGVYYVRCNDSNGNLYFRNPNPVDFDWGKDIEIYEDFKDNIVAADTWDFVPKEGDLYLFPSWAKHGVLSNTTNNNRISISFNISNKSRFAFSI